MRLLALLLLPLVLAAACGGPGSGSPASATLAVLPSPSASPTPTASPSPSPSALTSAKGAITVRLPAPNAQLGSPFTVSGDASVFEAALQWRLTDTAGRVLASGSTTASLGAPGRGTFSVSVTFTGVASGSVVIVEVFSRSPKDGEIDEIVRVPVTLR